MLKKTKKVSLLRYWTSRYFITLLIGLTIIGVISALWIRHTNIEDRLNLMEYIADDTVDRITQQEQSTSPENALGRPEQSFRDLRAYTYILNKDRNVISTNTPPMERTIDLSVLSNQEGIQKVTMNEVPYYVVQKPIYYNGDTVGYAIVLDKKENITKVEQQYGQLIFIIIALAFLGWCAIYILTKRLSKPIDDVSKAALQLQNGQYNLTNLQPSNVTEVDELVTSFKEMAQKLEQLEQTRTELLAGVTHELKTPVTSISGLLQAINDGVVEGEDAQQFLRMALNETEKMKTLVADLLAFNAYAVNAVALHLEHYEINDTINDLVKQWSATAKAETIHVDFTSTALAGDVTVDLIRLQQIFTNLFNNAAQAMPHGGNLHIHVSEKNDDYWITVRDSGSGIAEKDQPYIFERFYRGENKKLSTRGLGLGLPLSKMMAKSLGGDLFLQASSPNGTAFALSLPKRKSTEHV